ncbi:MAG: DNA-3-methyladenine glycosylase 2 family protein [bacterium]
MNNDTIEQGIQHLINNDKQLSTIIKKFGKCNIQPHRNYLNALLHSIIGQQLSVKAADCINKRFTEHFGLKPKPQEILEAEDLTIRQLGLSRAKTIYVKDLCSKLTSKQLVLKNFDQKTDEEIIELLTKVKGIGIWTAHMFLIFTLGRLNVLPINDLGIRKGVQKTYCLENLPTENEVKKISFENNWNPFNTIACIYIWKNLDN